MELPSGYTCICPKKTLEFGEDCHAHRASHELLLHEELEFQVGGAAKSTFMYLPGGAIRIVDPGPHLHWAQVDDCIAVFSG